MAFVPDMIYDLRHAMRTLAKAPGFALAAMLTLALGIGISVTVFTVANPILFRPLPVEDPDRLVALDESNPTSGFPKLSVSYADFLDWRSRNRVFADIALVGGASFAIGAADGPERVSGQTVTPALFSILGVRPAIGRDFAEGDDKPGAPAVAILSHGLWQRRFASDPSIVGRTIDLNGRPHAVIGVMPPGFRFPATADLWTPLIVANPQSLRGSHSYQGVARLKPGATLEQARADLAAIQDAIARAYPTSAAGNRAVVQLFADHATGREARTLVWLLLGAACLVLAAACANAANLFLARALGRQKEFAVRAALGSSSARTIRQLFAEGLILAIGAGALGLLASRFGVRSILAIVPVEIPYWIDFSIDGRILGAAAGISMATCLAFNFAPAVAAARIDASAGLKETGRGTGEGARRNRLRGLLIVSEVAVCMMLLSGAALMTRSVFKLQAINPGFDSAGVAIFDVELPLARYGSAAGRMAFFSGYLERLGALPGVQSAAIVTCPPFGGSSNGQSFFAEGRQDPSMKILPVANLHRVTPGYFATMRIPILYGRDFTGDDNAGASPVVIVDKIFAREYWPEENPVGRRVGFGRGGRSMEIVGVSDAANYLSLDPGERPNFYLPLAQDTWNGVSFAVRTGGGAPLAAIPAARQALAEMDASLPLANPIALQDLLRRTFWPRTLLCQLFAAFACLALVLAALGIGGVMAYMTAQRNREIGVRMALGARTGDVVGLVLRDGLLMIAIGLAIGAIASVALGALMSSQLYGVSPADPLAMGASIALFTAVALAACWIPARRASRVDPMTALRAE